MKLITKLANLYRKVAVWFATKRDNRIWEERLACSLANLPKEHHKWMNPLLETYIRHQKMARHHASDSFQPQQTKQTTDKLDEFRFEIVTEVLRELIPLTELVGVQPMQGPVSQVYHLESKEQENGQQRLEITSSMVQAASRKLQAHYTPEMAGAGRLNPLGDVTKEVISAISTEIAHDIVNEVLSDLARIAAHTETFDGIESTMSSMIVPGAAITINKIANRIGAASRRGCGNFIVVSPIMLAMLQADSTVKFVPHHGSPSNVLPFVGTLHGTIRVYMSHMWSQDDEKVLVGYCGAGAIDTGYIYCPYVMLMYSGVLMDPNTFMPMVAFMTRYGKITPGSNPGNYYGVVTIKNLLGKDPHSVDPSPEDVEDSSVAERNL